ncbi:hypothetical protein [Candidatus Methanoperedens nitratireducens]|uniref:Uncharacterized protein n=1 Tax=Candidatus Methanoperedens nitratireducens TaxID=1392998 RepID=A0A284VLH6_9EURY|nr:hypothetical protein [Candidatus Methanoperedens nitroreducens]SNQ60130.1 exported hypothetical protein [Candidatus Methanoperedens nitroreducens]
MEKKTMLVIGILGMLLAFGAMSVAMAQNTGDEKIKDAENHECTLEMMENMIENCPERMMQSGACGNMMNATNESSMQAGCSEMMGNSMPGADTESKETNHCGNMGSDMGSMMGSSATKAAL